MCHTQHARLVCRRGACYTHLNAVFAACVEVSVRLIPPVVSLCHLSRDLGVLQAEALQALLSTLGVGVGAIGEAAVTLRSV